MELEIESPKKTAWMNKLIITIIVIITITVATHPYWSYKSVNAIVTLTDTKVRHETGESTRYVYTDDGTFVYNNSWYFMKLNAADNFGKLISGKKYKIKYYGWRLPLGIWNFYPHIVSTEVVK